MKLIPINTANINYNKQVNKQPVSQKPRNATTGIKLQPIPLNAFSYIPTFLGRQKNDTANIFDFEEEIVKKIKGKKYEGADLYDKEGNIDWEKIGWENLKTVPFDITKATKEEYQVRQHALALGETKDTTWVSRYNKLNVTKHLATPHTMNFVENHEFFMKNLKELTKLDRRKYLDVPLLNENGKINFDFTVFDTETTSTNIYYAEEKAEFRELPPLDKIIQIGAVKVHEGQVVEGSEYDQLINPEKEISEGAFKAHGISNEEVANCPTIEHVLKPFVKKYLEKDIIVAYNSKFDITILNNSINNFNKNTDPKDQLKLRKFHKVLDPFILIQRIHPYMGARKKLEEQHKFIFGKGFEGAHDAFADTKATVDILKYCIYWLDKHKQDKSKPLTLRHLLYFQNGLKHPDLDFELDEDQTNASVNFDQSYRLLNTRVCNYVDGYKLSLEQIENIQDDIGKKNAYKLVDSDIVEELITDQDSLFPKNPRETASTKDTMVNKGYTLKQNYIKMLDIVGIEGYKDKSKQEVINIILDEAKHYKVFNKKAEGDDKLKGSLPIWMKNPKMKDIKEGNDMSDFEIARRVMLEKQ